MNPKQISKAMKDLANYRWSKISPEERKEIMSRIRRKGIENGKKSRKNRPF